MDHGRRMKYFSEANHYELLEVGPQASLSEVEAAYQVQLERVCGDAVATYGLFVGDEVGEIRRRLDAARDVLTDPVQRRTYDLEMFDHTYTPAPAAATPASANPDADEVDMESTEQVAQAGATMVAATGAGAPPGQRPPPTDSGPSAGSSTMDRRSGTDRRAKNRRVSSHPPSTDSPSMGKATVEPQTIHNVPTDQHTVDTSSVGQPPDHTRTTAAPAAATPGAAADGTPTPARAVVQRKKLPVYDGASLRHAREELGVTLEEISQETRIAQYYLDDLEADRFTALPPLIYLRAYLRQYTKAVGVDEEAVDAYLERMHEAADG